MMCFVRVVRTILGQTAIAEDKLGMGMDLVVLGIQVSFDRHGYQLRVDKQKAVKYLATMTGATLVLQRNLGVCVCMHGVHRCDCVSQLGGRRGAET